MKGKLSKPDTSVLCSFNSTSTTSPMEKHKINRLRIVLAEKDKTNKWLAEQLGYTESMISRWVSNKKQPPLEVLLDISLFLKVDIKELIESSQYLLKK